MKTRRYSKPIVALIILSRLLPVLWLCAREQRQYALNQGLVEAMLHTDNRTALALVNAGADPNVPCATSFIEQSSHLLHLNRMSVNNPNSVFMHMCGRELSTPDREADPDFDRDDLPLLVAMAAHGADVGAGNSYGDTALHLAVCANRRRVVEWLVQHNADINVQDMGGRTPLIMATSQEHTSIMYLLLAHGANPNLRNTHGWTALDYAAHQLPVSVEMVISPAAHSAETGHRHH